MKSLAILLFSVSLSVAAQDTGYRTYYKQAMDAYRAKAYPKFYTLIKEANELHPWHQGILYQVGTAAALTGHKMEAIENLKKAILIDNSFKIEGLSDFDGIKAMPEYARLLALQRENALPVIHSDTAVVIADRSLHAEGLDYDAGTKTFYVGSIHKRKIISIKDGKPSDFYPAAADGMSSIFGLKIDAKRNILWACSSPLPEMENFDSTTRSAIFRFDLTTGKLLEKFSQQAYEKDGVFGDLILNKKGDPFISDSQTNTIFTINEKTRRMEPWFTTDEFWNIQGLTFSDDEKYLFIADYIKGLFRLELKTKKLTPIKCTPEVSLKGIDGLTFYHGSLIAIQNGVNPLRATRYTLNSTMDEITGFDVLDKDHPAFGEPTLGVVRNDVFYYIANSQWGGYDDNHHIKADDQLKPIVILKTRLK